MSTAQGLAAKELSPRTAFFAIAMFVVLVGGVAFGVVRFLTGSPASSDLGVADRPMRTKASAVPAATASFDFAAAVVTRNLFVAPGSKPIIPPKADTPPPPFGTVKPVVPPPPPVVEPPKPKVAYTGSVEIGDATYALLEDLTTREAQYTKVGTTAFGCTLIAMTPNVATVQANGMTFALNLGENKVEEATAKPATPAPPTAQPAQPATPAPPATATPAQPVTRGDFRGRRGGNGASQ